MNLSTKPLVFDGEVRHIGPDDVMDFNAISTGTRKLETRDNEAAAKINELIGDLNGQLQLLPVVMPVVSLPGGSLEIFGRFRIPVGYEASLVNAAVATTPTASAAVLTIYHSAGTFGAATSGEGITTVTAGTTEFTVPTSTYAAGEFIFQIGVVPGARQNVSVSALISLQAVV